MKINFPSSSRCDSEAEVKEDKVEMLRILNWYSNSMLFNSLNFPKIFLCQPFVDHTRNNWKWKVKFNAKLSYLISTTTLIRADGQLQLTTQFTNAFAWLFFERNQAISHTIISTLLSQLSHVTRFETWKRVETWFKVKWKHYLSSLSQLDYLQLRAWKARKNLSSQLKTQVYRDRIRRCDESGWSLCCFEARTMLKHEPDFVWLKAETHWLEEWPLKRWDVDRLWWDLETLDNSQ